MLPDQYPRAHSIARQILKMEDAIAVLPLSVFDSPGELQAFPVEVSSTVIGDHKCIIFTPLKENPNPEKEEPSSSEEWETIPDIQVRHIWKLAEEDTCDVPEDQKTAILSPDWYHQNGTPICPECGSDMEYSHTEIAKSSSPLAWVAEDPTHGWCIQLAPEGNVPWYLLSDGTRNTFLPSAQPHLCWHATQTAAEQVARKHGYVVVSPKDQPLKLVVTKRSDDFHVCLEGDPKTWDCGKTQFEAVGKWLHTHRPKAVKWHNPKPTPSHGSGDQAAAS